MVGHPAASHPFRRDVSLWISGNRSSTSEDLETLPKFGGLSLSHPFTISTLGDLLGNIFGFKLLELSIWTVELKNLCDWFHMATAGHSFTVNQQKHPKRCGWLVSYRPVMRKNNTLSLLVF